MFVFIKSFTIFFLLSFVSILEGHAAVINAASCSQSSVQSAINSSNNGDTVSVPACRATWSSTLTFNKQVNLIGAGIGSTIITL